MAIKLKAADTHTVIVALEILREQELAAGNQWKVDQIDPLLKQYRRSFKAHWGHSNEIPSADPALCRPLRAEGRDAMSDVLATTAELEALRKAAGIPHLPTQLTFEARLAISGEGPRAYDWSDKPHRVVFDLCREIEKNAALPAVQPDAAAIREAALQDAISRVRQSLVDDAHKHGSIVTTRSSAMFTAEIIATNALSRLLSTLTGKEVMPDGTREVPDNDTAPASTDDAGGGAVPEPWNPATSPSMTDLMVDPDQMREDREERAKLAREDDQ